MKLVKFLHALLSSLELLFTLEQNLHSTGTYLTAEITYLDMAEKDEAILNTTELLKQLPVHMYYKNT